MGTELRTAPIANGRPPAPIEERRSEPRFPSSESGTACLLDSPDADPVDIRVLNISRNGVKVWIGRPVQEGSPIRVTIKNVNLVGEVRYCLPCEEAFHAGVAVRQAEMILPTGNQAIAV